MTPDQGLPFNVPPTSSGGNGKPWAKWSPYPAGVSYRVLASASGYSRLYQPVMEDIPALSPRFWETLGGLVRADMAYREVTGGGAVFAASAIGWCGSLSHAGYENPVSRITENVLRRFLAD